MTNQNFTAWFLENGFIGIPRNFIGFMEPLGLNFEDLGKILYLLYCGPNQVKKTDRYAQDAAKTMERKGLITWYPDLEKVDFSPMFDLIGENLGINPVKVETAATASEMEYSDFLKKIEKKLARFLTVKEKVDLEKAATKYNWPYDLLYEIYIYYQNSFRRQYPFSFFTQLAFGAKVEDVESLTKFIENLNYTIYKVAEIKKRLGHRSNPTEPEKECYLKWANQWKFSHEMILLAVEQTIHATDPSFSYIDKVLENWHQADIKTPEAYKAYVAKRKASKKSQTPNQTKAKTQTVEKNRRDLSYLVE
ncbi:MAG: DnaD domain-containing protein [Peptococcales bacterium]|jgi:DnaD/phage-associated family protein